MSVLIKGMNIPKSCAECDDDMLRMVIGCPLYESDTARAVDCPLVELPTPHGRLIDADKAKEYMDYVCDAGGWLEPVTKAVNEYVKKHIDAGPTIIEAEE